MSGDLSAVIDDIYEAAAFPERWPKVMDRVSALAGGVGGSLHVVSGDTTFRRASERLEPLLARWFEEGWSNHSFWHERALAFKRRSFYGILDLCSKEEFANDPMYKGFFAPRGYGWSAGSVFRGGPGELVRLNIQYRTDFGPVGSSELGRLNALRSHLGRGALLVARAEKARSHIGVAAFDAFGVPAAVISREGRLLACNRSFEQASSQVFSGARGILVFRDRASQALYGSALARASAEDRASWACSIPVPATWDQPAAVAHVVPMAGVAQDVFGAETAVLVLNPIRPADAPPTDILQTLFGFTPAEARLARALAQGQSLIDMAQETGLSRNTLKTQLSSIFVKTNTSRQAQLVSLLSSIQVSQ